MNSKLKVLVGGCFDLIHYGHIEFLRQAKTYGDHLIVLLESDERTKRLKGNNRPFHTQAQRKIMLEAIRYVDEVIPLPDMKSDQEYLDVVRKIKPSVIAFTEGDPILDKKIKQTEEIGARAIIISNIQTHSTTQLAKLLDLE